MNFDDESDGTLMKHILNHRLHDNRKDGDSECGYFVTVEFEMVALSIVEYETFELLTVDIETEVLKIVE